MPYMRWLLCRVVEYDALPIVTDEIDQLYQVPFEFCVKRANVSSIMCQYGAMDDVPSCANSKINNGVYRDTYGFQGCVAHTTCSGKQQDEPCVLLIIRGSRFTPIRQPMMAMRCSIAWRASICRMF